MQVHSDEPGHHVMEAVRAAQSICPGHIRLSFTHTEHKSLPDAVIAQRATNLRFSYFISFHYYFEKGL